jgi:predicted outer membrane protein
MKMNQQNLVAKLNQIVEQAQLTLQDPKSLTAERQRMIIALARFISAEMSQPSSARRDACGLAPDT